MVWNLNEGKIFKKFDLEDNDLKFTGNIVSLKQHPSRKNQIIFLTKCGEMEFFSEEKMEKKVSLNSNNKIQKQKLILLLNPNITVLDIRNLILYTVSDAGVVTSRQRASNPSIAITKNKIVLLDAQSNLIIFEKHLKNFAYYSFSLKLCLVDQLVRYLDYRDESVVREFLEQYGGVDDGASRRLKYKLYCLDSQSEKYFLSINVLQQINSEPIEYESLSNMLLVFEVNRCSTSARKIEIEIKRVHGFCKAYFLQSKQQVLAFNYCHKSENQIKVVDLNKSKNKVSFELNLDEGKLEKIVLF